MELLKKHSNLLELMSQELYDKETLGTDEIFGLILANIPEEEAELVIQKQEKAKEMRFDTGKPYSGEENPVPEDAATTPEEDETE